MSYAISLYHDQITSEITDDTFLPAANRLLYARFGTLCVNGTKLSPGKAMGTKEALTITASDDWAQLWRWEITPVNTRPALLTDTGTASCQKLSTAITHVNLFEGDPWLLRLDQMIFPAGYIVPCHTNAGPGIRCVKYGEFNFEEGGHGMRRIQPGEAFFESGSEPCTAWGSDQMETSFIRAMILKRDWKEQMATSFPDHSKLKPGPQWVLLHEFEITL
ncbi:MAG: hypothetical protein ABJN40_08025 [Sneathiella sp.]